MFRAFALALANAGNNIAARMAMMAMTTSSSINVKPPRSDFLPTSLFIFITNDRRRVLIQIQGRPGTRPGRPRSHHPQFRILPARMVRALRIHNPVEHRRLGLIDGDVRGADGTVG